LLYVFAENYAKARHKPPLKIVNSPLLKKCEDATAQRRNLKKFEFVYSTPLPAEAV